MSPAGKALWDALDRPNEWEITEHTARHVPSGTVRRIKGWASFFDGYEYEGTSKCLGIFERRSLWRKYKRMLSLKTACRFVNGRIAQRFPGLEKAQ